MTPIEALLLKKRKVRVVTGCLLVLASPLLYFEPAMIVPLVAAFFVGAGVEVRMLERERARSAIPPPQDSTT